MRVALRQLAVNHLTSEVGPRRVRAGSGPGAERKLHLHQGADFGGVLGEPVLALMRGIVRGVWVQLEDGRKLEVSPPEGRMARAASYELKSPFGWGMWVDVEHAPLGADLPKVGDVPLISHYHHISFAFVRKGQLVEAGQLLAALGHSGVGSGADHVHLGITGGDWCFDPRGFQLWTTATEARNELGRVASTTRPSDQYGPNVRKLWPISHVVVTPCFPRSDTPKGKEGVDGLAPAVLADGTTVIATSGGPPLYTSILRGLPSSITAMTPLGAFGAPPPPRPRPHRHRGGRGGGWRGGWGYEPPVVVLQTPPADLLAAPAGADKIAALAQRLLQVLTAAELAELHNELHRRGHRLFGQPQGHQLQHPNVPALQVGPARPLQGFGAASMWDEARRMLSAKIPFRSPVAQAIARETDAAERVIQQLPVADQYVTAQARYFWAVTAAMFAQTVKLVQSLKAVGQNDEYSSAIQAVIDHLFDSWDRIDPKYRIQIFDAMQAGRPMLNFGDQGFKANLLARLELLWFAADHLEAVQYVIPPQGQGALYAFLDATNKILRGIGAGAVEVAEDLAKVPGRLAGAALGSLPWGWIIVGGILILLGRKGWNATDKQAAA